MKKKAFLGFVSIFIVASLFRIVYLANHSQKVTYHIYSELEKKIDLGSNNFISVKNLLKEKKMNEIDTKNGFNEEWIKVEADIDTNISNIYTIQLDVNGYKTTPLYQNQEIIDENELKLYFMVLKKFVKKNDNNIYIVSPLINYKRALVEVFFVN